MARFGELLRTYRLRSFTTASKRALSQEQLADLLAQAIGMDSLSGSTISNWERDKYQIHKDDRATLVGLVRVLHHCGGIPSASVADDFLLSGNYRPLDRDERRQISPAWVDEGIFDTTLPSLPTAEFQEALLPPPSYTRLFGVDGVIDTLCEKLISSSSPWIISIVGLGGIGKTAVADAVARRLIQDTYFERVVWISAESLSTTPADISSSFAFDAWTLAIGEQVVPQGLERGVPERRLVQVRNQLKMLSHLIVIDNLEGEKQTTYLLDQLNDLARPSKFLLTARHHPPPEANVFIFPMWGLSTADALTLLRDQASSISVDFSHFSDDELKGVCDLVGGHPLALRLTPKLTMIQSLPQIRASLRQRQAGYIDRLYQTIYEKLWQTLTSYEKQLMQVMPLVAYIGTQPKHLIAISGLNEEQFWSAITELTDKCFIELRGTIHERRYGIHNLTEQFLYSLQSQTKDPHDDTFPTSVITNINYWKQYLEMMTEQSWNRLDHEYPNIFRAVQFSIELPKEKTTSALKEAWPLLSRHLFKFAERRGYWHGWIPLLKELIHQYEGDVILKCELLNQLGDLHRLDRQLSKAIKAHQEAEQLARNVRDEETLAHACASLGLDYLHGREYDVAESYGKEALELFDHLQLVGKELGGTLNLLGLISRAKGNLDTAEKYMRRSVQIWHQLEQPVELARALNNLAITLQNQQKFDQALQYFAEARTALEETTSELDLVMVALSEGSLYFELGKLAEAIRIFDSIDLSFLRQSGHTFYEALTLNNLGNVSLAQKDFIRAETALRQSVSLWEQIGEEVRLANTLKTLGDVLVAQGRIAMANTIYDRTSDILDKYPDDFRVRQLRQELDLARTGSAKSLDNKKEADHLN